MAGRLCACGLSLKLCAVPHIVQLPRLFLRPESLCFTLSARQDVGLCSLALPRLACALSGLTKVSLVCCPSGAVGLPEWEDPAEPE